MLQVLHQVYDLRLYRHIQRRNRFITDDEIGFGGKGPGNPDPLPLSAGKFVRIAGGMFRIQPHLQQQFLNPFATMR